MPSEPSRAPHVVVAGGGIAGLAAARALRRDLPPGARITLVEAGSRLGGKLLTERFAGVPLDFGADMWLARVPEATRLARDAGLAHELVEPLTAQAYLATRGKLRPLPEGIGLGVPSRAWPVVKSRVLSPAGLLRAGLEPLLPGRPVDGATSVGAALRRRFGDQVVDRLVDPLLGGVYAGRADDLDLDAAAPQVAALVRGQRSVYLAARRARAKQVATGPAFHSVKSGLSAYADAVARLARPDETVLGARVVLLERVGSGWRVTLAGGRALIVDAVVVATPAAPTATLLEPLAPDAAAALREITYADVAIVALGYRHADAERLSGSGFLVPATEGRVVKAATFTSRKWAHRAGGELSVVRCSIGRAGEPVPDLDDDALAAAAHDDLAAITGLAGTPIATRVVRWRAGLPQYAVGHGERIARVRAGVEPLAGLAVAGAAYDGVGIPACVRSGEQAAASVVAALSARAAVARGGTMRP